MRGALKLVLNILWVVMPFFASAQGYYMNQFSVRDNLSQDYVYTIVQDREGYLYVGTGNGINRYDGRDFENYSALAGLEEHFISSSLRVGEKVYFGHFQGGLSVLERGSIRVFSDSVLTEAGKVVSLIEMDNGNILGITQLNGFFQIESNKIKEIPAPLPEGSFIYMAIKVKDRLLLATSEGLYVMSFSERDNIESRPVKVLPEIPITTLSISEEGETLFAGSSFQGLFHVPVSEVVNRREYKEIHADSMDFSELTITDVEARDNEMWIATRESGLYKLKGEGNQYKLDKHFHEGNGFPGNYVTDVMPDREGSLWAGTYGNGLVQLIEKKFEHFTWHNAPKVNSVLRVNENHYLMATDSGMAIMKTMEAYGGNEIIFPNNAFAGREISQLLSISPENNLIVVEGKELYKVQKTGGQAVQVYLPEELAGLKIRFIKRARDSGYWVSAVSRGIFKLDSNFGFQANYSTVNGFIHNEVFALYEQEDGLLWAGTRAAGVATISKEGKMDYLTQKGSIPSHDINAIASDSKGVIWLATDGDGLLMYDQGKLLSFDSGHGLLSDYCLSVFTDKNDNVWVLHRKGLSFIQNTNKKIKTYISEDGIGEKGLVSGAVLVEENGFWMGTEEGVIRASIDARGSSRKFTPVLKGVRLFFNHINPDSLVTESPYNYKKDELFLPYDQNHLTFDFNALSFTNSNEIFYRYMLVGSDKGFSPPGRENSATYTNLAPGNYTLLVSASDDINVWVDKPLLIRFEIDSPFWEKGWFYALEIMVLVVLFTITYYLSIYSANKKRDKWILRIMVYICLFIVFEYIQETLEPYTANLVGGVPTLKMLINLALALLLFPVEILLKKAFYKKSA